MAEVESSREGAVQTITLNRPEVLNAFNRAVHAGLRDALKEARDPEVRAVVLTGAGRGFSAGQDLTEFSETGDLGGTLRATYHPNVLAIRALEKPVIAAVNGVCAGAGLSLACVCDFRIAADNASFVPGFIGIGLVPDAGGTFFLHRLLGASRAFEWMTSNRRLSAAEAHAWGLVSEVVEADVARRARGGARRALRGDAHARRRHDEAPLRPRRDSDARGAARARGAAAGRSRADRGLPRGRRLVPREARSEVHRPLTRRAQTVIPRPAAALRLALPASCARAAADVTAGKSRRCAASPRSCTAFATRRSAASQTRTAWASLDGGFSASSCRSAAS